MTLAKYETPHGVVELSQETIKQYLCPLATDQEAMMFLKMCQYQGLNPFLREAYLIKYEASRPATMVVGKDTFTQRAEAHPEFDGFRAGIVVLRDHDGEDSPTWEEIEGSLKASGETLLGGWAEVYRKDRRVPTKCTVSMEEYNSNQASWKKMPCTMIRKVALVQALREAFPSSFAGLYDSAEMGTELPEPESPGSGTNAQPFGRRSPKPVAPMPTTPALAKAASQESLAALGKLRETLGVSKDELRAECFHRFGLQEPSHLVDEQVAELRDWLADKAYRLEFPTGQQPLPATRQEG